MPGAVHRNAVVFLCEERGDKIPPMRVCKSTMNKEEGRPVVAVARALVVAEVVDVDASWTNEMMARRAAAQGVIEPFGAFAVAAHELLLQLQQLSGAANGRRAMRRQVQHRCAERRF